MRMDFAFRRVERSDDLIHHCQERMEKFIKLESKPMDIHFEFSKEGHECQVSVTVLEGRRKFRANSTATEFHRAVEMALNKLWRQFSKEKKKYKNRRHQDSHEEMHELLENPARKAG